MGVPYVADGNENSSHDSLVTSLSELAGLDQASGSS